MTEALLRTDWTRMVADGAAPDAEALRGHLRDIHRDHAGFTERCAGQCRDARGRTTYDWLLEAVEPGAHRSVLDLACGSGALLSLCDARLPVTTRLAGVDMSPDELALAAARLPAGRVALHEGRAQSLHAFADGSVDAVLCHWALTLMDPLRPVLEEIARILAPGGRFAALVDGPMASARGYAEVHDLIYRHVQAGLPDYGRVDLGDPRVRDAESLTRLVASVFPGASILCEPNVVTLTGPADRVARDAAGFFYAAFVLSDAARADMLADLAALLAGDAGRGAVTFAMPVNRLLVTAG
jgi:SAM-dependent methyltransferase